ncbi:MAG: hypothetical protein ACLFU9_02345 [Candidatus Bathyarchaeia archaeon]
MCYKILPSITAPTCTFQIFIDGRDFTKSPSRYRVIRSKPKKRLIIARMTPAKPMSTGMCSQTLLAVQAAKG